MTRRKFIQKMLMVSSAIAGTRYWILDTRCLSGIRKPHRFTRAVNIKKYPGRLRPLSDISKQNNWSG
jgi:hypothetical protein